MTERLQYPIQAAIDPETLDDPLRDEIQWFQPFSEPIRQLAGVAAAAAIIASTGMATIDPEALAEGLRDEIQWFQPLSEPVLRLPSVAGIPSFFIDPVALEGAAVEVVTLDEFQPLSVPVLPLPLQHPDAFVTDPTTLDAALRDEIQWFQALSEPVLPKPPEVASWFAIDPTTLDAALRDEIQWWQPFSEPVRPISRLAALIASGMAPIDTETLGEAGIPPDLSFEWWTPWPDQIWPAPSLHVSLQPYFVIDEETIGDVGRPPEAAVTGGYTPYAVYDPRQEKRVRDRRKELRREREELRRDIKRLVLGEPEPVEEQEPATEPATASAAEPTRPVQRPTVTRPRLDTAPIIARQARLEAVQVELRDLGLELKILQALEEEFQRVENELLTILLMVA